MIKKVLLILLLAAIVWGCGHKQYPAATGATNPIPTTPTPPFGIVHDTFFVKLPPVPLVPPATTNPIDSLLYDAHTAGTPNFNLRKPNFVIIHHTAQDSCGQTFYTFSITRTQVSAHYVICRDGTIHHLLNNYLRAWHAGNSKWGNVTDINSSSIGIELDNNGREPFPTQQVYALLNLLDTLKKTYNIPTTNFIGHADVAPTRKDDPSVFFPWKLLSTYGFGLWYDPIPQSLVVPEYFNSLEALRLIGYDTKDSVKAVIAFKRHFMQDTSRTMSESDKRILYTLYKKYI
ncbi:N-acetylmuramoyl-L-alanine amidase [Parasediminibacterium sp. JCM 36343]|uniref:N-acetylmuramoyl-L-alanine amidase n=1 Tax=Parasediminibacterium sp. JCM 36343 TaxID=3374279 RepID=UPI003979EE49